jgi:chromate transporter
MRARLPELVRVFLRLGCTSFGGPVAHIGYFHEEFVRRRGWFDEAAFAELVALCQFLPGPASSQFVFAVGRVRAGFPGAVVASLCFMLPSVLLMVGFAYGVAWLGGLHEAAWLHGLKLAAVAVVAQAVWSMGRRLCPDWSRRVLALAAAAGVLLFPGSAGQLGVIALGTLAGWLLYRRPAVAAGAVEAESGLARHHLWAAGTLVLYGALLVGLPALAAGGGSPWARLFDSFYRSGALVFGGGHVVLPLLRAELVPPGLMSDDAFLAGYGAAQALPGPLFSFAAYLGTVIQGGSQAWLGGLWCTVALFLPGWLLIGGALPFWHLLRGRAWAQAALHGANAAVVGVLLAALWQPVCREAVHSPWDLLVALVGLALLELLRAPSWSVVLGCLAAAEWLL